MAPLAVGSIVVAKHAVGNVQVVVTKVATSKKGTIYHVRARRGEPLTNSYFREGDKYSVIEQAAATPAAVGEEDTCKVCRRPTVDRFGNSMRAVLLCESCDGEVHLKCSLFKTLPSDEELYHCEQCASLEAGDALSTSVALRGGCATDDEEATMTTTAVVAARSAENSDAVNEDRRPALDRRREFAEKDSWQHSMSLGALEAECKERGISLSWSQSLIEPYDEAARLEVLKEHFAESIEKNDPTEMVRFLTHVSRAAACNGDKSTRRISADDLLRGSKTTRF